MTININYKYTIYYIVIKFNLYLLFIKIDFLFYLQCFIGESKNTLQKEYYVKWQSLPYSDATWEVASMVECRWPQKIKEFRDREGSKRTPSKACRALKYRPKFVQLTEEPEYFGGYDEVGYGKN